jgi:hypothetical protein
VSEQAKSRVDDGVEEFEAARNERQPSIASEFMLFIRESKKWWLIPILGVLGLIGLLAVLGSTGAAPFIYTLF